MSSAAVLLADERETQAVGAGVAGYPRAAQGPSFAERRANARRTILVADDDPALRETLADILLLQGYVVLQASDGDEALRVLEEHVDVVILDLHMPRRDGLDVLERLGPPPPQVVLYSAFALFNPEQLEKRNLAERVFRVLHKPIPPGELLGAVADAIAELP